MKRWFGPIAVLSIVGLAAALAGFNIWYRYDASRRVHAAWGTEALRLIAQAPDVELLTLVPAEGSSQVGAADIAAGRYVVTERTDLSAAKGVANFRFALGQDGSYEWDAAQPVNAPWSKAILFRDGPNEALIAFDLDRRAALGPTEETAALTSKMADGMREFLAEATQSKHRGTEDRVTRN